MPCGDAKDLTEDLAVADLSERFVEQRLDEVTNVVGSRRQVDRCRRGPEGEHGLHGLGVVAVDKHRRERRQQRRAMLLPEPSHDPEVEVDHLAVGGDEEIAGVNVAMEEAVDECRLHP